MINPCLVKEVAEKILCEIQAMKVLKNVSLWKENTQWTDYRETKELKQKLNSQSSSRLMKPSWLEFLPQWVGKAQDAWLGLCALSHRSGQDLQLSIYSLERKARQALQRPISGQPRAPLPTKLSEGLDKEKQCFLKGKRHMRVSSRYLSGGILCYWCKPPTGWA
jgi:hypothetical protein